jgi:hypothetical protein
MASTARSSLGPAWKDGASLNAVRASLDHNLELEDIRATGTSTKAERRSERPAHGDDPLVPHRGVEHPRASEAWG